MGGYCKRREEGNGKRIEKGWNERRRGKVGEAGKLGKVGGKKGERWWK
jgi:hypothetical protein